MDFRTDERVALFIDGVDLDAASRALDFHVDYKKVLELFRNCSRLIRANFYAVVDEEAGSLRPLIDWLGYNGYVTVTKPGPEPLDCASRRAPPPGITVELTIDALQLSKYLDHVVLFSGSADYRALLAALQKAGCRVTIVSSRKASGRAVADELRRQCDQFIELAELKSQIALEGSSRGEAPRARGSTRVVPSGPDARQEPGPSDGPD